MNEIHKMVVEELTTIYFLLVLLSKLVDFSTSYHNVDFVTVYDGNSNVGSNPTAIITDVDLEKRQ